MNSYGLSRNSARRRCLVVYLAVIALSCVYTGSARAEQVFVPMPKSIAMDAGAMPLTAGSRIMAGDVSLVPLGRVLAEEIQVITGLRLKVEEGKPGRGDIGLKINPAIRADADILAVQKQKVASTRDYAHTIVIGESAVVEGWDYRAVAEGTATILQAIAGKGAYSLPRMRVKDWPSADYTGVMIDVARQRIPIDSLKAVIEACRLWKVRYCQLHLADNEAFTFPSTAFPKLGAYNLAAHDGLVPVVYPLRDLLDLVAYADARGVTLVPELPTPGHTQAMGRAMPEVFGGPKVMNITNDELYKSLDTMIGEICDVFKSSPYFHIGGEDFYHWELMEKQSTKDYMAAKGIADLSQLLVQHELRMNALIRKRGKMTVAWQASETGTALDAAKMKDDFIIMCWMPYPTAEDILKQGFTTITVPWDLGVPLPEWNMYVCNGCNLAQNSKVLGSAQTMWRMSASALVSDFLGGDVNGSSCEGYIRSLCERMERTWTPTQKINEADYKSRLAATRIVFERLVFPVRIEGAPVAYRAWPVLGRMIAGGPVDVRLSLVDATGGGEIRYTLDGSEPTVQSPLYSTPFTVEDTTAVNAALFRAGKQVGSVSRTVYDMADGGGMIGKWLVSGPYTKKGMNFTKLFDVSFPPETGAGTWKPYSGGNVKFSDIAGYGGDDRVAYAKTRIFSPKAQKAKLLVGSDDGVKVFLNGKVVHSANVGRAATNPDSADVSLIEGWNSLMLKVTQGSGGWEAWAKLRSATGDKIDKMRVKAE